jgi:hypothetical protein
MSEQLQHRRGTAAQVAAFTGAQGEIVADTTNNRLVLQDGATAGGFAAAKLSEVPLAANALNTLASGANGANLQLGVLEFAVSSLSGATVTAATQIPANCIVLAVGCRVTTAITGAASFSVGVSGTPGQFGSALAIAAGSINYGLIGPTAFYSATSLVLTAAGGNFSGGAVRLSIHYILCGPSTS